MKLLLYISALTAPWSHSFFNLMKKTFTVFKLQHHKDLCTIEFLQLLSNSNSELLEFRIFTFQKCLTYVQNSNEFSRVLIREFVCHQECNTVSKCKLACLEQIYCIDVCEVLMTSLAGKVAALDCSLICLWPYFQLAFFICSVKIYWMLIFPKSIA